MDIVQRSVVIPDLQPPPGGQQPYTIHTSTLPPAGRCSTWGRSGNGKPGRSSTGAGSFGMLAPHTGTSYNACPALWRKVRARINKCLKPSHPPGDVAA